jgi:putative transposase
MPIKLTQSENVQTYFCTFTCKHWLHLFETTNLYDEIYKWFNILINKGNELEGFVIMPNHLHLLIFVNETENINMLLANGKRFLAYEIIKRLEQQQQYEILNQLELAVTTKEKQRKKKHRVFEVSSDIKPCYTEKFLLQKLNYLPTGRQVSIIIQ